MPIRKILWSLVAVTSTALAFSSIADDAGRRHADEAFKKALVTFAVARTLNGVISVAQGTELALEPGGVGVVLTLGQVLDPINDLVEQFSAIMLVATSSIGLQSVLLRVTAWHGLTLALACVSGLTLLALWWPGSGTSRAANFAIRTLLVTIFLRFAVPFLVIGTNLFFDRFLAEDQVAATAVLESTRKQIEEINSQANSTIETKDSFLDRMSAAIDDSLDAMNINEQLKRLRERVSDSIQQIIDLIVIFVLQTILLPIGFLWVVIRLLKSIGERVTRL